MEEYVFYVFLTIAIVVAHQLVVVGMLGKTGWQLAIEMAPRHIHPVDATALLVGIQSGSVLLTAAIWAFIIPTWVMIPIMVVGEAVAVWQLRKIAAR